MPPESTDAPPSTPTAISIIPTRAELVTLTEIANVMIAARIPLPPDCSTPQALLVKFLLGRELGLPPMVSLYEIDLIKGRAGMNARTQIAMIRRRKLGDVRLLRQTDTEAAVEAWRTDAPDDKFKFIFTMKDAQQADLTERKPWRKYPRSMLLARAASLATHALFQEVFLGVACTPEELGADVTENGSLEFIDVAATSGVQMKPAATMTVDEATAIADKSDTVTVLMQGESDTTRVKLTAHGDLPLVQADTDRAELVAAIKTMVGSILRMPQADWKKLQARWDPQGIKLAAEELAPLRNHLRNLVLLRWMCEALHIPDDKWQKALERRGALTLYDLKAQEAAEFEAKLAERYSPFERDKLLARLSEQLAALNSDPVETIAGNVSPPVSPAS